MKLNKGMRHFLSEKEIELVNESAAPKLKALTKSKADKYLKLARESRDKYRDIVQRQKASEKKDLDLNNVEKAKVFGRLVSEFQKRKQAAGKTKATKA